MSAVEITRIPVLPGDYDYQPTGGEWWFYSTDFIRVTLVCEDGDEWFEHNGQRFQRNAMRGTFMGPIPSAPE